MSTSLETSSIYGSDDKTCHFAMSEKAIEVQSKPTSNLEDSDRTAVCWYGHK
jgi:hypothetical protein